MKNNSATGFNFANLHLPFDHNLLKPDIALVMTASRTKENGRLIFNLDSFICIVCFTDPANTRSVSTVILFISTTCARSHVFVVD